MCALVTGVQTCALPICDRPFGGGDTAVEIRDITLQSSNRTLVGGHTTVECRDVRSVLGNVLVGGVELIARHRIAAARGDGAVGNTGDARGDACTGRVVGGAVAQQIGRASGRERVCQYV